MFFINQILVSAPTRNIKWPFKIRWFNFLVRAKKLCGKLLHRPRVQKKLWATFTEAYGVYYNKKVFSIS